MGGLSHQIVKLYFLVFTVVFWLSLRSSSSKRLATSSPLRTNHRSAVRRLLVTASPARLLPRPTLFQSHARVRDPLTLRPLLSSLPALVVGSAKEELHRQLPWPHSEMGDDEPPLYPEVHQRYDLERRRHLVRRPVASLPDRARDDFDGNEEDGIRRRARWINAENPPMPGEELPMTFHSRVHMLTVHDKFGPPRKFLCQASENVGLALRRENYPHPYQCGLGYCGMCLAKCTKGTFFHSGAAMSAVEGTYGFCFRNGHALMLVCSAHLTSDCEIELRYTYPRYFGSTVEPNLFQDPEMRTHPPFKKQAIKA